MTNFFTSDLHLGHARILELGAGRPFVSLQEMHSTIINNWFNTVAPEDNVFLLGDIAMGDFEQSISIIKSLTGNKFIVPGNHDRIFSATNSKTRVERFMPFYLEAGLTVLPENTSITLNTSFGEQEVLLSHFPFTGDSHSETDRFANNRFQDTGLPLVHGHTHGNQTHGAGNPREFHVGVDTHNFTPVHESQIISWIENLKAEGHI